VALESRPGARGAGYRAKHASAPPNAGKRPV